MNKQERQAELGTALGKLFDAEAVCTQRAREVKQKFNEIIKHEELIYLSEDLNKMLQKVMANYPKQWKEDV